MDPLAGYSEADLLAIVAEYFHELGFDRGELLFEKPFTIKLGHSTLLVGSANQPPREFARGRSDLWLKMGQEPLAIVETKAPDHPIVDDDARQAISYARLTPRITPFAIVTNGRETKVYDTYASDSGHLRELSRPHESAWCKNGQKALSIGDDLLYEASRILVDLNPETLQHFCRKQVERNTADLRGTIEESRVYVPELYLARRGTEAAFNSWLSGSFPFFAIVGDSGSGKTNFMCATAHGLLADCYVLFYSGTYLRDGVLGTIADDFIWEFHRERSPVLILQRFDSIVRKHNRPLIIFLDAIDESTGSPESLRAELANLAMHLDDSKIRFCISCKSTYWRDFVIDKGQAYNRLGLSVYPSRDSVHHPTGPQAPDSSHVGLHLAPWEEDELGMVWSKYKQVFSLEGDLHGDTRLQCGVPLILRLVAEAYAGTGSPIPAKISKMEIFTTYWRRKLAQTKNKVALERLLSVVAVKCMTSDQRSIRLSDIERNNWSDSLTAAYYDAERLGLLRTTVDPYENQFVAFSLQPFLDFVYTVRAEDWPSKTLPEVAQRIREATKSAIGVEAIEFYLSVIDQDKIGILLELAQQDFVFFRQIVDHLDLGSRLVDRDSDAVLKHLEHYAEGYSRLSRQHFPDLCGKIPPYSDSLHRVGLWLHGNAYQLRTLTSYYPATVLSVSVDVPMQILSNSLPEEIDDRLRPGGDVHLGFGEIANQHPIKAAWQDMRKEVAQLVKRRCLDESGSPVLLRERIWDTLLREPSSWHVQEADKGKPFWALLGFQDPVEIEQSPIAEVKGRAYSLLTRYRAAIPREPPPGQTKLGSMMERYRLLQIEILLGWLNSLEGTSPEPLPKPRLSADQIFNYGADYSLAAANLEILLPEIFCSLRSLISDNFSRLSKCFLLANDQDFHTLVLVTREGAKRFYSDFLKVGYIFLPSTKLPQKLLVLPCKEDDPLINMWLTHDEVGAWAIGQGRGSGIAPVKQRIGDTFVDEPHAFFCYTRFPSTTPVVDQVYRLLACEAEYLFGGSFGQWGNL